MQAMILDGFGDADAFHLSEWPTPAPASCAQPPDLPVSSSASKISAGDMDRATRAVRR